VSVYQRLLHPVELVLDAHARMLSSTTVDLVIIEKLQFKNIFSIFSQKISTPLWIPDLLMFCSRDYISFTYCTVYWCYYLFTLGSCTRCELATMMTDKNTTSFYGVEWNKNMNECNMCHNYCCHGLGDFAICIHTMLLLLCSSNQIQPCFSPIFRKL
jgi:hypothetical protein